MAALAGDLAPAVLARGRRGRSVQLFDQVEATALVTAILELFPRLSGLYTWTRPAMDDVMTGLVSMVTLVLQEKRDALRLIAEEIEKAWSTPGGAWVWDSQATAALLNLTGR